MLDCTVVVVVVVVGERQNAAEERNPHTLRAVANRESV
jgi:hypothetical protein